MGSANDDPHPSPGSPLGSIVLSADTLEGAGSDSEMRALKSEIKAWEREFLRTHEKKPTKDDVIANKEILELYKQYSKLKSEKRGSSTAVSEDDILLATSYSKSSSPKASHTALHHPAGSESKAGVDEKRQDMHASTGAAAQFNKEEIFRQKEESRARAHVEAGKVVQNTLTSPISPKKLSLHSSPQQPVPIETASPATAASFPSLDDVTHPTLYFIHPEPSTKKPPLSTTASPIAEEPDGVHSHALPATSQTQLAEQHEETAAAHPLEEVSASQELQAGESGQAVDTTALLLASPPNGKPFLGSIERFRSAARPTCSFYRFVSESGRTLLASARRELKLSLTPTYYLFDRPNAEYNLKESARWKVKGNFEGSLFRITERRTGDLLGLVHYTSSMIPRAMTVVYCTSGPIPKHVESFLNDTNFTVNEIRTTPDIVILKNILPKYNGELKTYCLNFNGRVTLPSVKNFQLAEYQATNLHLQFGRTGKDEFAIDVIHPLPMFMAFSICLSTFDAVEKV